MNQKLKNIAQRLGLKRLYTAYWLKKDERTAKKFVCSIGDILLKRDEIKNNQLLLTSRLMDVEAYLEKGDHTFPYQNTISRKAYGDAHREDGGNRAFAALIESYLKEGYRLDSFITCDRDMTLMDGNHRMGLHIYEMIETVNVRRVPRVVPFPYATDWYYRVGLPSDFIDSLKARFSKVQSWLLETGNTFCALVGYSSDDSLKPMKDLAGLVSPLRMVEFGSPYIADNQENGWGGVIQFSISTPKYDVVSGNLVSRRVLEIENVLNSRYGGKAPFLISHNCLEGKQIFDSVSHLIR